MLLDFVALLCNCVTWLCYFATSLRYIPCPLASRFPYVASLQSYIASETETETEMMTEMEPELQKQIYIYRERERERGREREKKERE